jgi:hypothetical protein
MTNDDTKSIDTVQPRDTNTDTVTLQPRASTAGRLFRLVSTLDAEVHVTLEGTDDLDGSSFALGETISIGGGTSDPDADTKSVAAGDATTQVESVTIDDHWPWLEFSITAQTTPTTGEVEIREVKNF